MIHFQFPLVYVRKFRSEIEAILEDGAKGTEDEDTYVISERESGAYISVDSEDDYTGYDLEAFFKKNGVPFDRCDNWLDAPTYSMYRPADNEAEEYFETRNVSSFNPQTVVFTAMELKEILDSTRTSEEKLRDMEELVRSRDFPPYVRIEDISTKE